MKQTLLSNYSDDAIPKSSYAMLSSDNGNKSDSGKFILNNYAQPLIFESMRFDLVVVDFMALIFSQPPSHVYSSTLPLELFCSWLISAFICPYIEGSSKVVVCIDRKELDKDFPLKFETHKLRKKKILSLSRWGGGTQLFCRCTSHDLE